MIALSGVWKGYGSLSVLKDVSIDLRQGQVHMLLGENGAGSRRLSACWSEPMRPTPARFLRPAEARRAGINAVMQDFSLAPSMTVAENYFLGREETRGVFLRKREMRSHVINVLAELGVNLDVDARVETLSRPEQQLLEGCVRALGGKPRRHNPGRADGDAGARRNRNPFRRIPPRTPRRRLGHSLHHASARRRVALVCASSLDRRCFKSAVEVRASVHRRSSPRASSFQIQVKS